MLASEKSSADLAFRKVVLAASNLESRLAVTV
jgi:hypothetical protein